MRNFQKLKTLSDFSQLDAPEEVALRPPPSCPFPEQKILRMLVRPKYGSFRFPGELRWLSETIKEVSWWDYQSTGIEESWCYVTVRHGPITTEKDDEWHFDGASFRTGLIPERNYIWVSSDGPQYKLGGVSFPSDFDPCRHHLFRYAERVLRDEPVSVCKAETWYRMSPFCFHRRNPEAKSPRTFLRISFPDIEGRDVNNTENPLLPTPAWGRDPVREFRDRLETYGENE